MASTALPENYARYLLIESRQQESLMRELYETDDNPTWAYAFADTDWQAYLNQSPLLVEANKNSTIYRWALKGLKQEKLTGLILESDQGFEDVLNWIRKRLTVRFDGNRRGLLRFYDPMIWHQLAPLVSPQESVISRVIYWYGPVGHQRWLISESPELLTMLPMPTLSEGQRLALAVD